MNIILKILINYKIIFNILTKRLYVTVQCTGHMHVPYGSAVAVRPVAVRPTTSRWSVR